MKNRKVERRAAKVGESGMEICLGECAYVPIAQALDFPCRCK